MRKTLLTLSVVGLLALNVAGAALAANGFANGGFEDTTPIFPLPAGGATSFAANWLSAPTGNPVLLSSDAHSGLHSALLSVPNGFGGSTMFQNAIDQGFMAPLIPSDVPTLTFWAKGDASTTGNILVSVRYLNTFGAIVYNTGNVFFQNSINPTTWTKITVALPVVPPTAHAAFIEMNTAVGPLLDGRPNAVLIDDILLQVTAPVPTLNTTWGRLKSLQH